MSDITEHVFWSAINLADNEGDHYYNPGELGKDKPPTKHSNQGESECAEKSAKPKKQPHKMWPKEVILKNCLSRFVPVLSIDFENSAMYEIGSRIVEFETWRRPDDRLLIIGA